VREVMTMAIKFYKGERIYLRPLELSDEADLRKWFNDPDNWRTLKRSRPIDEQRERELIEEANKSANKILFGICTHDADRLIGCCGLVDIHLTNRCATFGITIGDAESKSRGFGTEATRLVVRYGFEELNLNRIELSVFAGNAVGIRSYERSGFTLEGRDREAYFRSGQYHDALRYGILRREWFEHEDAKSG
jgi:diamine N-acetyltransferase